MRYAIIDNKNIVVNITVSDSDYAEKQGWILINNDRVDIGWSYINGQFIPAEIDNTEENKKNAINLLIDTDWVELPSVSNTSINPHLINVNEFLSYRSTLRDIAVNTPKENITFPTKPDAIWSN